MQGKYILCKRRNSMFAATKKNNSPFIIVTDKDGRWLIGRQGEKLKKSGRREQELMEDMVKGFMVLGGLAFAAGTLMGAALSGK